MLKKFFSFLSVSGSESNTIKADNKNQEQLALFYQNKEWDAVRRVLNADKTTSINATQSQFIFSQFQNELKEGNYHGTFSRFFFENSISISTKNLIELFQSKLPKEATTCLLQTFLNKYSNLSTAINYLEKASPYESFAKYIIHEVNHDSHKEGVCEHFKNYLRSGMGNLTEENELLFYVASPLIAQNVEFEQIKNSSHASQKIIRAVFSQIRQASLEKIKINKPEPKAEIIPPTLENLPLNKLPSDVLKIVNDMVEKTKKFSEIKNYSHDPDDAYFLQSLTAKYLPPILQHYLEINPEFRDTVLSSQKSSATEILKETLNIYVKRLDLVQSNILEETNKRLKLQGRFIQQLSNNLEHYQAGTSDQIDEFPVPDVPIRKVRLNTPS